MGDVNAVCTPECDHRQLLAARALNDRYPLIRGLFFPHEDDWIRTWRRSCHPQYFSVSWLACRLVGHWSAASRCPIRFPPDAYECGQVRQCALGRVLWRTPSRRFRDARIPTWTPSFATMLVAAVGINRTLLQRLRGGLALAFAFRREAFASLDVSNTAAATWSQSRRCWLNGALLDEFLLVTRLSPLLETNLRADPCETLHATDASLSCAVIQDAWFALYDLAEEKGEDPPSYVHDGRCTTCFGNWVGQWCFNTVSSKANI